MAKSEVSRGDLWLVLALAKKYTNDQFKILDPFLYKGGIDCSSRPNFPAANKGHFYKCTRGGRIGGVNGKVVSTNDAIVCNTDNSAAGNFAAVGDNWDIFHVALDINSPSPFDALNIYAAGDLTYDSSGYVYIRKIDSLEPALEGDELPGPDVKYNDFWFNISFAAIESLKINSEVSSSDSKQYLLFSEEALQGFSTPVKHTDVFIENKELYDSRGKLNIVPYTSQESFPTPFTVGSVGQSYFTRDNKHFICVSIAIGEPTTYMWVRVFDDNFIPALPLEGKSIIEDDWLTSLSGEAIVPELNRLYLVNNFIYYWNGTDLGFSLVGDDGSNFIIAFALAGATPSQDTWLSLLPEGPPLSPAPSKFYLVHGMLYSWRGEGAGFIKVGADSENFITALPIEGKTKADDDWLSLDGIESLTPEFSKLYLVSGTLYYWNGTGNGYSIAGGESKNFIPALPIEGKTLADDDWLLSEEGTIIEPLPYVFYLVIDSLYIWLGRGSGFMLVPSIPANFTETYPVAGKDISMDDWLSLTEGGSSMSPELHKLYLVEGDSFYRWLGAGLGFAVVGGSSGGIEIVRW